MHWRGCRTCKEKNQFDCSSFWTATGGGLEGSPKAYRWSRILVSESEQISCGEADHCQAVHGASTCCTTWSPDWRPGSSRGTKTHPEGGDFLVEGLCNRLDQKTNQNISNWLKTWAPGPDPRGFRFNHLRWKYDESVYKRNSTRPAYPPVQVWFQELKLC